MITGIGTAVNVATVLLGATIGVLAGHRLPSRTRDLVTDALGLVTLLIAGLSAVSVNDPALSAKVERVCQQVGLEAERRTFHPHITLARWKGRRTREVADFLERRRALVSEPFEVSAFTLFESRLSRHGARYDEAASYPLA